MKVGEDGEDEGDMPISNPRPLSSTVLSSAPTPLRSPLRSPPLGVSSRAQQEEEDETMSIKTDGGFCACRIQQMCRPDVMMCLTMCDD